MKKLGMKNLGWIIFIIILIILILFFIFYKKNGNGNGKGIKTRVEALMFLCKEGKTTHPIKDCEKVVISSPLEDNFLIAWANALADKRNNFEYNNKTYSTQTGRTI